jgi:hypothetical protein
VTSWQAVLTAALIGSERAVVPPPSPGFPAQAPVQADPAAELLDRAALLTAARRAGVRPVHAEPPPAAAQDSRPVVSPAASRRLARILGGDPAASGTGGSGEATSGRPELLTEWLIAVVACGLRPPPEFLPALLDLARRGSAAQRDAAQRDTGQHDPGGTRRADEIWLPELILAAGGPRAFWLAGLNPAWARLLTIEVPAGRRYVPGPYLSAAQLAEVLGRAMREITQAPLGAHRAIRLAGSLADPALGAPDAMADFPPEAPNVLHSMLAALRFRYEMLKELEHADADG